MIPTIFLTLQKIVCLKLIRRKLLKILKITVHLILTQMERSQKRILEVLQTSPLINGYLRQRRKDSEVCLLILYIVPFMCMF